MTSAHGGESQLLFPRRCWIGYQGVLHDGPFRTVDDLELGTLSWVRWFNQQRMHSSIEYVTPIKYEQEYHRQTTSRHRRSRENSPSTNPRAIQYRRPKCHLPRQQTCSEENRKTPLTNCVQGVTCRLNPLVVHRVYRGSSRGKVPDEDFIFSPRLHGCGPLGCGSLDRRVRFVWR